MIHDPGGTPGEGIGNLCQELCELVGTDIYVNIETEDKRLVFRLWRPYQWTGYNLYWLPVKFVERLRTPLRLLAISFLHHVHSTGRIGTINQSEDMEMVLEWYADNDDWSVGEREGLLEVIESYRDGQIHNLMEEIEKRSYHNDLPAALAAFDPENAYEKELVDLMIEGLKIFVKDGPTIFDYCYDPFQGEQNDDCPVNPDQTIMMVHDSDFFMDSINESLNEQAGNNGEIIPCTTLTLRPNGDTLFAVDEYPGIFFRYMEKLLDFLNTSQDV